MVVLKVSFQYRNGCFPNEFPISVYFCIFFFSTHRALKVKNEERERKWKKTAVKLYLLKKLEKEKFTLSKTSIHSHCRSSCCAYNLKYDERSSCTEAKVLFAFFVSFSITKNFSLFLLSWSKHFLLFKLEAFAFYSKRISRFLLSSKKIDLVSLKLLCEFEDVKIYNDSWKSDFPTKWLSENIKLELKWY